MAEVVRGRRSAEVGEAGVVVFLIGMRVNRLWRVDRWLPVAMAMPAMVRELVAEEGSGLLARPRTYVSGRTVMLVQYWDSFERLELYARAADRRHLPAWRRFNRVARDDNSVGVWHETYVVAAGTCESVYANMPDYGLALATRSVPPGTRRSAALRLGRRELDESPVEEY